MNRSKSRARRSGRIYEGQGAIHTALTYLGQRKNYTGKYFRARRYFVSTVGTNEEVVKAYIKDQEKEDQRAEQLSFFVT